MPCACFLNASSKRLPRTSSASGAIIAPQARQNLTLSAPPRPVAAFVSWTFLLALRLSAPVALTAYRKLFVNRRCSHMASIYYHSLVLTYHNSGRRDEPV